MSQIDWPHYQRLCDRPWYCSRHLLEQTMPFLSQAVADKLRRAMRGSHLQKPMGFKGDARSDMFLVSVTISELDHIVGALTQAKATGQPLPGFVEAWSEYRRHLNKGELKMSSESVVVDLIDAFNRIDLDGIVECFAEDAVYHNMPMEAVQGKAAIRAVLDGFMGAATEVSWELLHIASVGDVVLTERVDRFKINDGWIALPVMGTFEVADGKITAWRDYFDLADFQKQAAEVSG